MKRYVLFLLCFITALCTKGSDYLNYHRYINLAEYHLVHARPDSAFYYYDLAFAGYDFIFAKDALIAAQLAWKQGKLEKTEAYLIKGAQSGLKSKCIETCPILVSFMNNRVYEQLYYRMKDAVKAFEAGLDQQLREEWIGRFGEQVITLSYSEPYDFTNAVLANVARLKELVGQGKFPGERYIGLEDDCKTLENHTVFFALANYESAVSELHDGLWEAVKRGALHPRELATLWEWEYVTGAKNPDVINNKITGYVFVKLVRLLSKDNVYLEINRNYKATRKPVKRFGLLLDAGDTMVAQIDSNRAAYYICSMETDALKMQLQEKQNYRFFFGNK